MIAEIVFIFILGLLIGSFINVCIYRIPSGRSIVRPPSHCPKCGVRLKPYDLIPVLSYVLLKGRCRYCKEGISFRYTVVELLMAFLLCSLYLKYSLSVQFLAFAYIMAILAAVFFIDIDHRIIPDELVLAGIAGGIPIFIYNIFNPLPIYGDSKWWNPLIGGISGSGILLLIAIVGLIIYKTDDAMGMGDVKLFAPIGIFLGWRMCLLALFLAIILGGVLSIILVAANKKDRKDTIPFGPFIVAASYIVMMWGWDLLNWYVSRL